MLGVSDWKLVRLANATVEIRLNDTISDRVVGSGVVERGSGDPESPIIQPIIGRRDRRIDLVPVRPYPNLFRFWV